MPGVGRVRYTVLRSAVSTTETALIDLGGPGLSLFGAHWPLSLRETLPTSLRHTNLLLLEEPWVTHSYDDACRTTARAYYQAVRAGGHPDGGPVAATCQLGHGKWGWTAQTYQSAVTAVATAEHLTLSALAGASFAGHRLSFLTQTKPTAVYLVDPAPAVRVDGSTYLTDRRRNALDHLMRHGCHCDDLNRVVDAIDAARNTLEHNPVTVPGRSVPVNGADVGAAVLAMAYQPATAVRAGWSALREPVRRAALLGALSDNTWPRFGIDDLSPGWLAYLDEACAAFPGWRAGGSDSDTLRDFLQAFHAPCASSLTPSGPEGEPAHVVAAARICVVVANDGVTGSAFTDSWRRMRNVRIRNTDENVHGSLRVLSACDLER